MIRNSTKLTAIAAVALLGGATALNCSKASSPSAIGDVKLAFALPDGLTIKQVSYQVHSSSNTTLLQGTIDTSDKNATVSLDLALPPSNGDTISLTATTTTGVSCTGTSTAFNIVAGASTTVSMGLACGGGSQSNAPGVVIVNANVTEGDNCPSITSSSVAPAQTSVGGSIAVAATGVDPDATDTVTYSWGPTAANFASPTAASTTFTCTVAGTQNITLTISDGRLPTPCTATVTLPINCIAVSTGAICGNAVVETGEQCDPPNGTTCDATCHTITSSTGGTTGAAGAPATGGVGGTAGANGTGGVAGSIGTGVAGPNGTGGVAGSNGTGVAGSNGSGGSASPSAVVACVSCEFSGTGAGNCFNTSKTGLGATTANFGCNGFTGSDLTNCLALQDCLSSSACQTAISTATADYGESQVGNDSPLPCLCGNVAQATCLASTTWTGVCAPQFVAAAAGGSVLSLFTSTDSPEGVAANLFTCDIDNPCSSQCSVGH